MTKAELTAENIYLKSALIRQENLTKEWQKKATERLDLQMLEARIKLASNVGQMVEAVSKAITYIVGKEVM